MHGGRRKATGEPGMDADHIAFFMIVGGAAIVLAAAYWSKAK
jgi:hypothetical protein